MNEEYGDLSKVARGTGKALQLGKSSVQGAGKVVSGGAKAVKGAGKGVAKFVKILISLFGTGTVIMAIIIILLLCAAGGAIVALLGHSGEVESDTSVDASTFENGTTLNILAQSYNSTSTQKYTEVYFISLEEWRNASPRPADWCTAYVGSLMKQTGISLSEYSWKPYSDDWYNTLADEGKILPYTEAHEGDLIFTSTHVGILVDMDATSGYYLMSSDFMDTSYGDYVVKSFQITQGDILGILPMPKTGDTQFTIRKKAPSADNEYYKNENSAYSDVESELLFTADGTFQGGIRAYAWARAYEVYGDFFYNRHPLPVNKPSYEWYDNYTYSKGSSPKAGSIACWKGEDGIGLVAFVESVKKNGNMMVSYSIRSNDSKQNFVYKEIKRQNGTYKAFDYEFQGFLYLNEI